MIFFRPYEVKPSIEALMITAREQIKPEHLFANSNPVWEKIFYLPPLPQVCVPFVFPFYNVEFLYNL